MVPGQRGWAGLPASACQCPACWRSWVQIPALLLPAAIWEVGVSAGLVCEALFSPGPCARRGGRQPQGPRGWRRRAAKAELYPGL